MTLISVSVRIFSFLSLFSGTSFAFSLNQNNNDNKNEGLSRRDLLTISLGVGGAVVYGKLVSDSVKKLSRGDLVYPDDHEMRVETILAKSLLGGAVSLKEDTERRPLRVLEVGIGKEWRVGRRGLYKLALKELSSNGITEVHLTGMDIVIPNPGALEDSKRCMSSLASENQISVTMGTLKGSITSQLSKFTDGSFDSVVCSLTLCSVDNQDAALHEIKRLVRPDGGTFGYIEHVAVHDDEPYKLLALQQQVFDPFQQAVADNCHLHRYTDENIAAAFQIETDASSRIYHERFFVNDMWPVSCQCCGVIQRHSREAITKTG
jgi:SAM-dependent methyltransferase